MQKYPLVILPGWLLGSRRYQLLSKNLINAGCTTYIVDFPGFEQSKPLDRIYTLEDYVQFLSDFLQKKKINAPIFIAHSFGGRVVLKYLYKNPKVAKAVIFSGTPGYSPVPSVKRVAGLMLAKVGNALTLIPPFLFFRRPLQNFLYKLIESHDFSRATGYLRETFKYIVKEDLSEYMKNIKVPTLLLWGEDDKLVSPAVAYKMNQAIKGSTINIIKGEKHMFPSTNSELFVKYVLKFINTL